VLDYLPKQPVCRTRYNEDFLKVEIPNKCEKPGSFSTLALAVLLRCREYFLFLLRLSCVPAGKPGRRDSPRRKAKTTHHGATREG
jgi:hypothetical protein